MAQQLVDLGEHVTDRTLTLNLIRGLNERFSDAGCHIRRGNPFPKFKDAVNELILEELTMAHQPSAPSIALLAAGKGAPSGASPSSSSGARPSSPQQPSRNGGSNSGGGNPGGKSKDRRRRSGKSRSGETPPSSSSGQSGGAKPTSTPSTGGAGGATWPSFLHSWAGAIQMWPGPRPTTPRPAAPTA